MPYHHEWREDGDSVGASSHRCVQGWERSLQRAERMRDRARMGRSDSCERRGARKWCAVQHENAETQSVSCTRPAGQLMVNLTYLWKAAAAGGLGKHDVAQKITVSAPLNMDHPDPLLLHHVFGNACCMALCNIQTNTHTS